MRKTIPEILDPPPTRDRVLLIDADSIVFGAGFATEKMRYYLFKRGGKTLKFDSKADLTEYLTENDIDPYDEDSEDYAVKKQREPEPEANALFLAGNTLRNIQKKLGSERIEVYLTGTDNFRYDLATIQPYKGNRVNAERPIHEKAIREYLTERWGAKTIDGREADDEVSIRQMKLWPDSVIVSADKDLDMVPGWHSKVYAPKGETLTPYYITFEDGMYNFYYQLLTGDPTDHIRGVPGVGPKKAAAILSELETEAEMYAAAYEEYLKYHKKCLEKEGIEVVEEEIFQAVEDEIIENGRLLWMQTHDGEMWVPPQLEETDDQSGGDL